MYKQHEAFESPTDPNIKIWRFMDFTKFVALLETRKLFFTRADKFDDPFEGSYSKANQQLRPVVYKDMTEDMLKKMSSIYILFRQHVALNCWHMNEYESAAMWKLYVKGNEGIALQSTFTLFKNSFNVHTEDDIFVGKVKYIDYEKDWMPEGNLFCPFMHKRISFEHERELRALLYRFPTKDEKMDMSVTTIENGIFVSIDLNVLINAIFVSPTSPEWFYDLAQSIVRKYGLDKSVIQSSLAGNSPIF